MHRCNLIAKIDEQILLTSNKDCAAAKQKWITDEKDNQNKVEVAKRVKRWWPSSIDVKISGVMRYVSKPLEFTKGKNAIEISGDAEANVMLRKMRDATELGELDALIEEQAQLGRRLTLKSK